MKNPYDVIKSPFQTEKGISLEPQGKYLFWVQLSANKLQIKRAVETIYDVKVKSVNTMIVSGKKRRVRLQWGWKPNWKKAIVTLKKGQKIELK